MREAAKERAIVKRFEKERRKRWGLLSPVLFLLRTAAISFRRFLVPRRIERSVKVGGSSRANGMIIGIFITARSDLNNRTREVIQNCYRQDEFYLYTFIINVSWGKR